MKHSLKYNLNTIASCFPERGIIQYYVIHSVSPSLTFPIFSFISSQHVKPYYRVHCVAAETEPSNKLLRHTKGKTIRRQSKALDIMRRDSWIIGKPKCTYLKPLKILQGPRPCCCRFSAKLVILGLAVRWCCLMGMWQGKIRAISVENHQPYKDM